jgi:hypothetical protein
LKVVCDRSSITVVGIATHVGLQSTGKYRKFASCARRVDNTIAHGTLRVADGLFGRPRCGLVVIVSCFIFAFHVGYKFAPLSLSIAGAGTCGGRRGSFSASGVVGYNLLGGYWGLLGLDWASYFCAAGHTVID